MGICFIAARGKGRSCSGRACGKCPLSFGRVRRHRGSRMPGARSFRLDSLALGLGQGCFADGSGGKDRRTSGNSVLFCMDKGRCMGHPGTGKGAGHRLVSGGRTAAGGAGRFCPAVPGCSRPFDRFLCGFLLYGRIPSGPCPLMEGNPLGVPGGKKNGRCPCDGEGNPQYVGRLQSNSPRVRPDLDRCGLVPRPGSRIPRPYRGGL